MKNALEKLGAFGALAAFTTALALAPPALADKPDYRETVRRYYEQYQSPGFTIDELLAFYTDDIDFIDPTFDIRISGKDEFRTLYADIGADKTSYQKIEWTLSDVIVAEDDVVIHGRWAGEFSGCPFEVEFVTLWRMENGLIARQRDFFAASAFDQQVGWRDGKAHCSA